MPWKNQTGGPWGGGNGGGQGPWGSGGRGGGGRGGGQPPNFEDMIRRGQDNMKRFVPGGMGSPRGIILIVLIAIAIWLATGIYRVNPTERGVELVFGKLTNVTDQGLHWNWPAPIGEVFKPEVFTENRVDVGFRAVGTRRENIDRESLMLTGDENIINIQMVVFWRIDGRDRMRGVRNYLFNIRNPEPTVKNVAESALREIVGKTEFEAIRTVGRTDVETEAQELIQSVLDEYGSGIEITRVQLQNIDPPGVVIDAFRDVQAAQADRERIVNQATAYLNRVVQEAQGEAERTVRAGEAFKEEKVAQASGDTSRFLAVYTEYAKSREITRRRIYLDTMREVLQGMEKIIIDDTGRSGVVPYLPLDQLMRDRRPAASPTTGPDTSPNSGEMK